MPAAYRLGVDGPYLVESYLDVKRAKVTIRAALYVDGFNLYHSIVDLEEPFLKWLNLWALGELIIPKETEKLVKVTFCTAFYPTDTDKRWRHEEYMAALKVAGVEIIKGHYILEPMECKKCPHTWDKPTEKETDINVALSLINDAWQDGYDTAYLLTADSDQAATARSFKELFPQKRLVTVAPPGRNFSVDIVRYAAGRIALTKDHLERCLFGPIAFKSGMRAGRRPHEYEPPSWWMPPDKRPQSK